MFGVVCRGRQLHNELRQQQRPRGTSKILIRVQGLESYFLRIREECSSQRFKRLARKQYVLSCRIEPKTNHMFPSVTGLACHSGTHVAHLLQRQNRMQLSVIASGSTSFGYLPPSGTKDVSSSLLRSLGHVLRLMIEIQSCLSLRTPSYGNYGIFLIVGSAGFLSSTVRQSIFCSNSLLGKT